VRVWPLILLSFVIAGCSSEKPSESSLEPAATPAQGDTASFQSAIDDAIFASLPFNRPQTLEDLQERLGKPLSIKTVQVVNRHTFEKDAMHQLIYPDLTLDLYETTGNREVTLVDVQVTGNQWTLPSRIQIGRTREDVLRVLGKPARESASEWTYDAVEGGYMNTVSFKFEDDKVVSMSWHFDID